MPLLLFSIVERTPQSPANVARIEEASGGWFNRSLRAGNQNSQLSARYSRRSVGFRRGSVAWRFRDSLDRPAGRRKRTLRWPASRLR
jgi:hypothetical protein